MRPILLAIVISASALAGCGGGGVHVPMGTVPSTAEMGDMLGQNAVYMSCQVRGNRSRLVIRCPGVNHPERRIDIIVSEDGRVECVAAVGLEDDCQPAYDFLVGNSADAGGATEGPATEPPVGARVYARAPGGWYRASVIGSSAPGSVIVNYDDDYAATLPDESVTLDRIRFRL